MTVTLTHQQMLQTWRRCAGLEPSVTGCTIERFDGVDIDRRLSEMMRQWYLGLLDSGDPSMAGEATDAGSLVTAVAEDDGCTARLRCDASVRRLCSVRLTDWQREASVVDEVDAARRLELQANRFSRAGNAEPLVWRDSGGHIHASPASEGSAVVAARGYIDTGPDSYRVDERALATIPTEISLL